MKGLVGKKCMSLVRKQRASSKSKEKESQKIRVQPLSLSLMKWNLSFRFCNVLSTDDFDKAIILTDSKHQLDVKPRIQMDESSHEGSDGEYSIVSTRR